MPKFNPLDHPICLASPRRLVLTAWSSHIPFAMALIDLLRPRLLVELGSFTGVSYCAFLQAVKELKLNTSCFAIDTWKGDEQTGFYGEDLFENLTAHHDSLYKGFSTLVRSTFDEALSQFQDGSIDLLHIDGYHEYDAVKADFQKWLPKMSERGVVLMHDTRVRERNFGVWKVWEELSHQYPHFEFEHGYGLGILSTGPMLPDGLKPFIDAGDEDAKLIRQVFKHLGETWQTKLERELLSQQFHESLATLSEKQAGIVALEYERDAITLELNAKSIRLNDILNSRAWRWVCRYGRVKMGMTRAASRVLRRATNNSPSATSPEYARWLRENDLLSDADRQAIGERLQALNWRPLISVIMPTYNVKERWLRAAIESVRKQLYPNWELCIADDCSTAPHVRAALEEYAANDSRIKVTFREQNGHIAAASNSALELATGEFVALLDHDDEIAEHALYMIAEELNAYPAADLIYSDEDKLSANGERHRPHFKPDWSPDLFYSYNLITHFCAFRKSLMDELNGFNEGFPGSQDYDLMLRCVEAVPSNHIRHIPHVLYHWRTIPGSVALDSGEKEYAHEAARDAIRAHFKRKGVAAEVTAGDLGTHRVRYALPDPTPLVSIIIGTRDRVDLLKVVVSGLLEGTDYPSMELLIIDNQSSEPQTLAFLDQLKRRADVQVISYDAPFNFAAINNLGVRHSAGEILCFLNNDIKVISPDWLTEMVSHAVRKEVGAVGAKLYYANDRIQHAGVVLGVAGIAGHAHKHLPKAAVGYAARMKVVQNFAAVTGACMVLRRAVFDEVGGLDDANLAVAYNDIDLCLRIRDKGYRIVWTPHAELYHFESASRGPDTLPETLPRFRRERAYMSRKWGHLLRNDPCYNPNLSLDSEDFSLARVSRAFKPWKRLREDTV